MADICGHVRSELQRLFAARFPEVTLRAADWAVLERRCERIALGRGATLFSQGERASALLGVLAGEIEIRFGTADGRVSVVEHVKQNGLFGLASFVSGLPSRYDAIAVRPTRLVAFGPAAYAFLMDEIPGFARSLMSEIARRHDGTLGLLEAARHRTPRERLTLALQHLIRAGRVTPRRDGAYAFVRGSQGELAALCNLSRQTVNGLLAALSARGLVRPGYGGVWVPATWLARPAAARA